MIDYPFNCPFDFEYSLRAPACLNEKQAGKTA
jgi:hypothetical protein